MSDIEILRKIKKDAMFASTTNCLLNDYEMCDSGDVTHKNTNSQFSQTVVAIGKVSMKYLFTVKPLSKTPKHA